jgi:hypothetical protein
MDMFNRAWVSVQRSCFKITKAHETAVVQNMKRVGLIIVLNADHDPVDFENLNAEVFADYMVYMVECCTRVIQNSFDGGRSTLYHLYCFYCREYSHTMEIQMRHAIYGKLLWPNCRQQEHSGRGDNR